MLAQALDEQVDPVRREATGSRRRASCSKRALEIALDHDLPRRGAPRVQQPRGHARRQRPATRRRSTRPEQALELARQGRRPGLGGDRSSEARSSALYLLGRWDEALARCDGVPERIGDHGRSLLNRLDVGLRPRASVATQDAAESRSRASRRSASPTDVQERAAATLRRCARCSGAEGQLREALAAPSAAIATRGESARRRRSA